MGLVLTAIISLILIFAIFGPKWFSGGTPPGELSTGTVQGSGTGGSPVTTPIFTPPPTNTTVVTTTTVTTTSNTAPTTTATITAKSEAAPTTSAPVTATVTPTASRTTATGNPQPTTVPAESVVGEIPGTPLPLGVKQSSVVDKNLKPRDVYALSLTAGQEVQLQLDSQSVLTVELAEPGSTSFQTGSVTLAFDTETGTWEEQLFGTGATVSWTQNFTQPVTGTYYLAVISDDSAQPYTIQVLLTGQ